MAWSDSEVVSVRASWAAFLVKYPGNKAGQLFYKTLFQQNPRFATSLFKDTDMVAQSDKLIEMFTQCTEMLTDREHFEEQCVALGARHAGYGVDDAHYPAVGAVLVATLKTALAQDMTPAATKAWSVVYGEIQQAMLRGVMSPKGQALAAAYAKRESA
jgi:hemoglobin-like flavoprotein